MTSVCIGETIRILKAFTTFVNFTGEYQTIGKPKSDMKFGLSHRKTQQTFIAEVAAPLTWQVIWEMEGIVAMEVKQLLYLLCICSAIFTFFYENNVSWF